MLLIIRVIAALLIIGGVVCGLLGYHKLSQSWPLQEQARKLFNEAYALKDQHLPYEHIERQGSDFATRAHDLRHPGELWLIAGGIVGGAGLLSLVLPPVVGTVVRAFRPRRTYASYEELIATEAREQLQPGEQLLNTTKAIRGGGRHWETYCVLLTDRRLILMAVRPSLLAGFQFMKYRQEEYDTDRIIGCAIDQHWKGNDIILQFPEGELLLRLHFTGKEVSGQRRFWEEVPARFAGRGPTPGEIIEERLRKQIQR
jgi:hypothetical protein